MALTSAKIHPNMSVFQGPYFTTILSAISRSVTRMERATPLPANAFALPAALLFCIAAKPKANPAIANAKIVKDAQGAAANGILNVKASRIMLRHTVTSDVAPNQSAFRVGGVRGKGELAEERTICVCGVLAGLPVPACWGERFVGRAMPPTLPIGDFPGSVLITGWTAPCFPTRY